LKEKLLAAHRAGIMEVLLPKENEKDLPEVPENLRSAMKLHFVETMDQVLQLSLERPLGEIQGVEPGAMSPLPPATDPPAARQ
jgi:ATP-dependent Lon protease